MLGSVITIVLVVAFCCLAVAAPVFDGRTGRIPNALLASFAVGGIVLDVVLYGWLEPDYAGAFVLNFVVVAILALALFFCKIWGGGDSKLACTLALLLPVALLPEGEGLPLVLPFAIALSFCLGYLYVLGCCLRGARMSEAPRAWAKVRGKAVSFLSSFVKMIAYIAAVRVVLSLVAPELIHGCPAVQIAASLCVVLLVGRVGVLRRWAVVVPVLAVVLIVVFVTSINPFAQNPLCYVLAFLVALSQPFTLDFMYETVPTTEVTEGMILSTSSSAGLMGSRVRGLPGLSDESMGSRLTADEAESVRRWGKTAKGSDTLTVVRKVPFAIFVSLGFACVLVAGVVLR